MLAPFTKALASEVDEDNGDDSDSEGEGEDNEELEAGREEFDDLAVEDAMKEVQEKLAVLPDEAKVA